MTHLPKLRSFNIKAYSYWHDSGDLIVVSENKVSDLEIKNIQEAVSSFPDSPLDSVSINTMKRIQEGKSLLSKLGVSIEDIQTLSEILEDIKKNEILRHYKLNKA